MPPPAYRRSPARRTRFPRRVLRTPSSSLERMHGCADGRAVVVDDAGRVVGVLSASDVARTLQLADLRSFDPYPAPSGADLTSR